MRNEPANIRISCEYIAQIKKTDIETVARITRENTMKLFPKIARFIKLWYSLCLSMQIIYSIMYFKVPESCIWMNVQKIKVYFHIVVIYHFSMNDSKQVKHINFVQMFLLIFFLRKNKCVFAFYTIPPHWKVQGERFKNSYELINLWTLKFLPANKIHIFQCMGKIFCVEFQRYPLKFHTKYLTHTLKDMIFIQHWNFNSS